MGAHPVGNRRLPRLPVPFRTSLSSMTEPVVEFTIALVTAEEALEWHDGWAVDSRSERPRCEGLRFERDNAKPARERNGIDVHAHDDVPARVQQVELAHRSPCCSATSLLDDVCNAKTSSDARARRREQPCLFAWRKVLPAHFTQGRAPIESPSLSTKVSGRLGPLLTRKHTSRRKKWSKQRSQSLSRTHFFNSLPNARIDSELR